MHAYELLPRPTFHEPTGHTLRIEILRMPQGHRTALLPASCVAPPASAQRPDAARMKSYPYSDIGRSPGPSGTRAKPIKRGSRQRPSRNWRDAMRTRLSKRPRHGLGKNPKAKEKSERPNCD